MARQYVALAPLSVSHRLTVSPLSDCAVLEEQRRQQQELEEHELALALAQLQENNR